MHEAAGKLALEERPLHILFELATASFFVVVPLALWQVIGQRRGDRLIDAAMVVKPAKRDASERDAVQKFLDASSEGASQNR